MYIVNMEYTLESNYYSHVKLTTALSINLRRIMKDKGLTQVQLCDLSGVTQASISEILNEKKENFETQMIAKLAIALKVQETDLTSNPKLIDLSNQIKALK